jgi:hypothetical protein
MLRIAVFCVGAAAMLGGGAALVYGLFPPAFVILFWGALLAGGIVFERVVYKKIVAHSPGPGWVRTPERFVDETSGKPVTVFVEPATGERAYVEE